MSPIVRTFMGTHLDLSKVVSISDALWCPHSHRHSGMSATVGVEIHVQLRDEPIKFQRELVHGAEFRYRCNSYGHIQWSDPREVLVEKDAYTDEFPAATERVWAELPWDPPEDGRIVALLNLQAQIDDLVAQWKRVTA